MVRPRARELPGEGPKRDAPKIIMRKIAQCVVLKILRAYKWAISPMFPPACRYVPTCSEYAAEAVERYGALRGSWMAVIRLLRCHPFVKGGYDPVVRTSRAPDGPVSGTHCHRAI